MRIIANLKLTITILSIKTLFGQSNEYEVVDRIIYLLQNLLKQDRQVY